MTRWVWLFRGVLAVLLCAGMSGCLPSGKDRSDEEKEPHYLEGKNRVSSMDYRGAIEEFKKAVELNPRSASAHFELALLYEQKDPDPAAAIYHFEEYLRLRPKAENAETVRQHIFSCKQDLAKAVLLLPTGPGMQRELEQLAAENKRLNEELEKWRAYAGRTQTQQDSSARAQTQAVASAAQLSVQSPQRSSISPQPGATSPAGPPAGAAARTHTVQDGETFFSISKKYSVKLDALIEANPGVDPKRLRIGQTLKIPSS